MTERLSWVMILTVMKSYDKGLTSDFAFDNGDGDGVCDDDGGSGCAGGGGDGHDDTGSNR